MNTRKTAPGQGLRAGDADRDVVIDELGAAMSEGRLDMAEYERRLAQATTASTLAQLETLTADLPPSGRAERAKAEDAEQVRKAAETREWLDEWRY